MQISIDVTNWLDEYMQEEVNVSTLEALIDRATQDRMTAKQLSRLVIVARERGEIDDDDMLPANKALLNTGGALSVNMMMSQQKRRIETNGKTYLVRELIAPVRDSYAADETQAEQASQVADETHTRRAHTFDSEAGVTPKMEPTPPDTPYLVRLGSPEALRRAELYLERRVPGYIMGRLLVIKESGGDVEAAGDMLKEKIDEMVGELT